MKQAYPNDSSYIPAAVSYDISKWMETVKQIYFKVYQGHTKEAALKQCIASWLPVEQYDFLAWMKYYESGDPLKYKAAQYSKSQYYASQDVPSYFVPNPVSNTAPSALLDPNSFDKLKSVTIPENKEMSDGEKRKIIEQHRRKLLGRLNSVEKLLSAEDGNLFAGPEFERLLDAIYNLKKQIQTINKINLSSTIYVDLIIRQANILEKDGCYQSSNFLRKFAQQTPGAFNANLGPLPLGDKIDGTGTLENTVPASLINPTTAVIPEEVPKDPLDVFVDRLGNLGLSDDSLSDDSLVDDSVMIDDDVLLDQEIVPEENDLMVEAQSMPIPDRSQMPDMSVKPNKPLQDDLLEVEEPLEVEDVSERAPTTSKDIDQIINSALSNITVQDAINQLEEVAKIFRTREVNRRMAIADMMLRRLGLASLFDSFAEAQQRALADSQYCLTRIDDIISKLRGTIEVENINLMPDVLVSPEAQKISDRIKSDDIKDQQRKQMRKQVQDTQLQQKIEGKPPVAIEQPQAEFASVPTKIETSVPALMPVEQAAPVVPTPIPTLPQMV